MPELPEVETVRLWLLDSVLHKQISKIVHEDDRKYSCTAAAHGLFIQNVRRRGKYLILPLGKSAVDETLAELVVHLAMSGNFKTEPHKHARVKFEFADESALYFTDARRFGRVRVVGPGEYSSMPTLHEMGPEPLSDDFSLAVFAAAAKKAGPLKPWLLSQRPVAGLGNIYVDEALFAAQIHPEQRGLGADEAERLFHEIRRILAAAVEAGGSSLGSGASNYRPPSGEEGSFQLQHAVYGKAGQPCPRCGGAISKTQLGGRGTHFCPRCQSAS